MYQCNLVIIERPEYFDDLTEDEMERAISDALEYEMSNRDWCDWYRVGGHWTGLFDGYNPETDLANIGRDPTDCVFHRGDIIPLDDVTDEQYAKFERIVLPDRGGVYPRVEVIPWESEPEKQLRPKEVPPLAWLKDVYSKEETDSGEGFLAVVVDTHG